MGYYAPAVGVYFGEYHSYRDFGLVLDNAPVVSPPEPKTSYIEIPGASGSIDLSEALTGFPTYKNRTCSLVFHLKNQNRLRWPTLIQNILNKIHGKRMQIVFDEDANYYWFGRINTEVSYEERLPKVSVSIEMNFPFKRATSLTTLDFSSASSAWITDDEYMSKFIHEDIAGRWKLYTTLSDSIDATAFNPMYVISRSGVNITPAGAKIYVADADKNYASYTIKSTDISVSINSTNFPGIDLTKVTTVNATELTDPSLRATITGKVVETFGADNTCSFTVTVSAACNVLINGEIYSLAKGDNVLTDQSFVGHVKLFLLTSGVSGSVTFREAYL